MIHTLIAAVSLSLGFVALAADSTDSSKKLYHVVSVKFKSDATKEQITAVEKAFVELKAKVPGIASLDWGTNISSEKRDNGFTHCFVLTFASEANRDAYLVHPDHKAFGRVLGPVRDDVMVRDFWCTPIGSGEGKIFHVVSLKFKEAATKEKVSEIEKAFAALKENVPNVVKLAWGTNISPEKKDHGFTHCFVLNFANEADRDVYLTHPAHKAFVGLAGPSIEDVMVIDFASQK